MKTICFFNSVKNWGGGEKWFYDAVVAFASKGYNIILFAYTGGALYKKIANVDLSITLIGITVSNFSFLNYNKLTQLKKSFQSLKPDVIIINQPRDLKLAGIAAKQAGIKKIIYRRGSAIPVKNNFLNRYLFKKIITGVLVNSEETKKTILQKNDKLIDARKIKVIYNPINTAAFLSHEYNCIYQKKNDEIIIGSIGRMVKQKNQKFLIDLSLKMQQQNVPHKILIGGSGKLESELKTSAIEKNVQNNIVFAGFIENVKDLLMCCDVFLLPSLWEGFGYVLAEAALCKKPSIAFNISSNPELVIDKETGFLTGVNDVEDCFEKINFFYTNPSLSKVFGERAFTMAINKFDEAIIMKQIEQYLQTEI